MLYANITDDLSLLEQQMKKHGDKAMGTDDGGNVKLDTQRGRVFKMGAQGGREKIC